MHFSFNYKNNEVGTIIIPIFQVRRLRYKKANNWPNVPQERGRGQGRHPGSLAPEPAGLAPEQTGSPWASATR